MHIATVTHSATILLSKYIVYANKLSVHLAVRHLDVALPSVLVIHYITAFHKNNKLALHVATLPLI